MPDDERRVTHHVIEHATTLELAAPEPGHVRTAMLFGRAGEIWAAGGGGPARPEERVSRFDLRRENLILEITVLDADLLRQLENFLRLGNVPSERLLAGDAFQLTFAAVYRVD